MFEKKIIKTINDAKKEFGSLKTNKEFEFNTV